MPRRFKRKVAQPPMPGGAPPPGGPRPMGGPGGPGGGTGGPSPGGPGPSGGPTPGGPPSPGPMPPGGPGAGPMGQPKPGLNPPPQGGDPAAPPPMMRPRVPDAPPGAPGEVPTDVTVDAATGNVSISKGPVTIRIAKYEPDNPPDRVKHLSEKQQRKFVHVYNSAVDNGADEESANKQAWAQVDDKEKKNKGKDSAKTADVTDRTGSDWDEFNAGNVPEIDNSRDEIFYETHDDPYAAAKNRRAPATVDITASVPEGQNAQAVAFALQMFSTLEVETSGNNITIKGVQNPIGMLNDLRSQGIDASVKGSNDFSGMFQGEKVAIIGDYPDMNYYPNDQTRKVEATVVQKEGDKFLLRNDTWGAFYAEEHEIERLV